jgi:hypothetical protein
MTEGLEALEVGVGESGSLKNLAAEAVPVGLAVVITSSLSGKADGAVDRLPSSGRALFVLLGGRSDPMRGKRNFRENLMILGERR